MATTDRTSNPTTTASKNTASDTARQPNQSHDPSRTLARRDPFGTLFTSASPFGSLFQRWNDEMDRFFDDFGGGFGSLRRGQQQTAWMPQVEMFQRGSDLVVRADLPGMKKEDLHVDVTDDVLTIQGERRHEQEEDREGWYRSERSYGSFHRSIPLPDGTIADSAKASFKDGVLEVTLQAPSKEVSRGRRVNIE
jgi:HSP20 family protein